MKKVLYMLLSVCIVFVVFVACSTAIGESEPSARSRAAKNEKEIYFGVAEPITGANSEGGNQELLGIRYANSVCPTVDIAGETYTIKLLETDNESDANKAAIEAQRIVNSNPVAVLGCYGAEESEAAKEIYAESGIPLISVSRGEPQLALKSISSFSVSNTSDFQGKAMANFAYGKGLRTAAIVTQAGSLYSEELGEIFSDEFLRLGGSAVAFSFDENQTDFETISVRIDVTNCDMVFLPAPMNSAPTVIKQLRRNGVRSPIFGTDSFDSAASLKSCSIYGKNVYFCSGFDETSTEPVPAEFVVKFKSWINYKTERYELNGKSDFVSPIAAQAYDSYMVLVKALKSAQSLKPEDISKAIAQVSFDGVSGKISFDESGNQTEKLVYIKTYDTKAKSIEVLQTSSVGK